jgi:hypothetical protein
MKAPGDPLSLGQAASYRGRAACWQAGRKPRLTLLLHEAWTTALFCPERDAGSTQARHFDPVIAHPEAARIVPGYPA